MGSEPSPLSLDSYPGTKNILVLECGPPRGGDVSHGRGTGTRGEGWRGDERLWSQTTLSFPADSLNKPHHLSSVTSSGKWRQQEMALCWMLRGLRKRDHGCKTPSMCPGHSGCLMTGWDMCAWSNLIFYLFSFSFFLF